jgi:hypothetical protein
MEVLALQPVRNVHRRPIVENLFVVNDGNGNCASTSGCSVADAPVAGAPPLKLGSH